MVFVLKVIFFAEEIITEAPSHTVACQYVVSTYLVYFGRLRDWTQEVCGGKRRDINL
jgi:hypothetical protein